MVERIYTGAAAKEIDRLAIVEHGVPGFELMTEAGQGAFKLLQKTFAEAQHLLVLCGGGNNGGDGYVLARCALEAGWPVSLIATGEPKTDDAELACAGYVAAGGKIGNPKSAATVQGVDIVVDALLGIGLQGAARGAYAQLIELTKTSDCFVFSLDVPSGVDADTGTVFEPAVRADLTATFIVKKIGLTTGRATSYVGELQLIELDVPTPAIEAVDAVACFIEPALLPLRAADSHKGNYGHVVVAGGDHGMFGAALLCGKAALRSGSGKVTIVSTDEHLDLPAQSAPELMSAVFEGVATASLKMADVIALGPGLAQGAWGRDVFAMVSGLAQPRVIDADGLTHLARLGSPLTGDCVLTPHPAEAASLLGSDTQQVQADRLAAARAIAKKYKAVCVLKGAGTIVADPQGVASVCDVGNPGMASAGMGDVLTGIIAALIGQGLDLRDAAETGVWLHSVAADLWVEEFCEPALIASDVIETLPLAMQAIY